MKMNNITVFNNEEFGQVRVISIEGAPWFVGKDVAERLGYSNPSKAISTHCKNGIKEMLAHSQNGKMVKTQTTLISEGDVYRLIIKSKLPNAQKFESWVMDEILPSIRKHGAYMTENTIEKALTNPDFLIQLATNLKEEQEKRRLLEEEKKRNAPKVIFADAVSTSHTSILVGDLAKLMKQNGIDIGGKRLFKYLRENGYLIKRKGTDYNMPTQKAMELKLFEVKETTINHSEGRISISKTPKVTGKGQQYFINKFLNK